MPGWPAHWAGDVLLADGGTAHVRPIAPQDDRLLAAFHARLSPESIYLRFFSPHPRLSVGEIEHFTRVDHDARVALVVLLGDELIGVGRYDRLLRSDTAEVAFVVGDAQQGRGIATLLLERLAAVARERGLHRFSADVLPHNRAMLRVFHDAGFEVTSRFEDGVVRLSFPIDRTPEASAVAYEREWVAQARSIERLLAPHGIGVIAEGVAAELVTEVLLRQLADGGFAGPVRRLSAHAPAGAGAGLDLIFVAVPPELLRAQIERCAGWGVYAAVLLASGGPEDEAATARGDRALALHARGAGLRLLGPASLGLARPLEGKRLEAVAAPVQLRAGGLALFTESSRRGRDALAAVASRGLGISTFFSAGRKADVSASDALQFWEGDPATRVIGLSLRSLGNPRRSAAIARRVSRSKPVLVWLADLPAAPPEELVLALDAHTGMIRCVSLDDLLDVAEALLAPVEAKARDFVDARITAWERWRRSVPGRSEAPEGVDRFEARRRIDELLAETGGHCPRGRGRRGPAALLRRENGRACNDERQLPAAACRAGSGVGLTRRVRRKAGGVGGATLAAHGSRRASTGGSRASRAARRACRHHTPNCDARCRRAGAGVAYARTSGTGRGAARAPARQRARGTLDARPRALISGFRSDPRRSTLRASAPAPRTACRCSAAGRREP